MESLQQKTCNFSKIDFGILITCSAILGLQLYDLTSWYSDFQYLLVSNIAPLIVGTLGVVYSFMQSQDMAGKVILGLICVLDAVFSIWWIILQIEDTNLYQGGYNKFIHILSIVVYGSMYLGPFLLSGFKLWRIIKNVETPQEVTVNVINLIALISVSIMIIFNQNLLFMFGLFGQVGFAGQFIYWWDVIMGFLSVIGYPLVIFGLIGTLKNHLQFMMIYCLGQIIIWLYFFIAIALLDWTGSGVYKGIYIGLMALILLTPSVYKTHLLKNNPEQDKPEYNQIV